MAKITVDGINKIKRYDFSGVTLPTDWGIVSMGTNQSVSVANSILSIVSGTDINQETIVRCSSPVTIKTLVRFVMSLSQRIANQNFYLELVNAAGTTYARYDFNGATATTAQCVTANEGTANSAVSVTVPTTASYASFDIFADINDVLFSSVASNTNASKSGVSKFDRLALLPDEQYYIQIRVLNGGTAPASSTTINIDSVSIQDLTGINVDLQRGDGAGATSMGVPVNVANSISGVLNLNPSTSYGASTLHQLISAATTNATSVKTAVGLINEITLSNTTESPKYFKLYNKASAPTVGTDTPVRTVLIPANSTIQVSGGVYGIRLTSGIAYAITGAAAVADTTAVAAGNVIVGMSYA